MVVLIARRRRLSGCEFHGHRWKWERGDYENETTSGNGRKTTSTSPSRRTNKYRKARNWISCVLYLLTYLIYLCCCLALFALALTQVENKKETLNFWLCLILAPAAAAVAVADLSSVCLPWLTWLSIFYCFFFFFFCLQFSLLTEHFFLLYPSIFSFKWAAFISTNNNYKHCGEISNSSKMSIKQKQKFSSRSNHCLLVVISSSLLSILSEPTILVNFYLLLSKLQLPCLTKVSFSSRFRSRSRSRCCCFHWLPLASISAH